MDGLIVRNRGVIGMDSKDISLPLKLFNMCFFPLYRHYVDALNLTFLKDVMGNDSCTSRKSSSLSSPLGSSATPKPSAIPTTRQLSP